MQLTCPGSPPAPTFTCKGPTDTTYGPQKYPKNCGNPMATCDGNLSSCVNAYFFPMFSYHAQYQPVGICSGGRMLTITFLSGQ